MSLYDHMHDHEQTKCFYHPVFYNDGLDPEGATTHVGGEMRYFKRGSNLPIKTRYYNYPENFCIFDYRKYGNEPSNAIHVVQQGVYINCLHANSLRPKHIMPYWVDYYGHPINITCVKDVLAIIADFEEFMRECKEIYQKYGSNVLLNEAIALKNTPGFQAAYDKYQEVSLLERAELSQVKTLDKWRVEESFINEKQLGEFWETFEYEESEKDKPPLPHCNYLINYQLCKAAFKKFLEENPGILDSYITWQNLGSDSLNQLHSVVARVLT